MVNRAAGSRFMSKAKDGDVVVVLPPAEKFVVVLIVPKLIPWEITVDKILVMSRPEVKGLLTSTVTSLMLFCRPVVGRTGTCNLILEKCGDEDIKYTFKPCRVQKICLETRQCRIDIERFKCL